MRYKGQFLGRTQTLARPFRFGKSSRRLSFDAIACVEALERRQLRAAFPDANHSPPGGTGGDDTIVFKKTSNGHYQVSFNGTLYDYGTGVLSMAIDAGDGTMGLLWTSWSTLFQNQSL
jgi:hypothetical protein